MSKTDNHAWNKFFMGYVVFFNTALIEKMIRRLKQELRDRK